MPLEQFMFPLALACDAVLTDDRRDDRRPDRGRARRARREGRRWTSTLTRERYPRVAELPFDTAYKLMATFHRMTDEAGRRSSAASSRARRTSCSPASGSHLDPALATAAVDDAFRARYLAENERLAAQGLRVMATARRDFDAAALRPRRRPARR